MQPNFTKKGELPDNQRYVIACGRNFFGKIRRIRAYYVPKFCLTEDNFEFEGDYDYCEENDLFYVPQGWYEANEMEEINWKVDFEILCWWELPEVPKEIL